MYKCEKYCTLFKSYVIIFIIIFFNHNQFLFIFVHETCTLNQNVSVVCLVVTEFSVFVNVLLFLKVAYEAWSQFAAGLGCRRLPAQNVFENVNCIMGTSPAHCDSTSSMAIVVDNLHNIEHLCCFCVIRLCERILQPKFNVLNSYGDYGKPDL